MSPVTLNLETNLGKIGDFFIILSKITGLFGFSLNLENFNNDSMKE